MGIKLFVFARDFVGGNRLMWGAVALLPLVLGLGCDQQQSGYGVGRRNLGELVTIEAPTEPMFVGSYAYVPFQVDDE